MGMVTEQRWEREHSIGIGKYLHTENNKKNGASEKKKEFEGI